MLVTPFPASLWSSQLTDGGRWRELKLEQASQAWKSQKGTDFPSEMKADVKTVEMYKQGKREQDN